MKRTKIIKMAIAALTRTRLVICRLAMFYDGVCWIRGINGRENAKIVEFKVARRGAPGTRDGRNR